MNCKSARYLFHCVIIFFCFSNMGFCGAKSRRLTAFITAAILIILGLLAAIFWGALFHVILKKVEMPCIRKIQSPSGIEPDIAMSV